MYEGDSGASKERFVTIEELETAGLVVTKTQSGFTNILDREARAAQEALAGTTSTVVGATKFSELLDTSVAGISGGQGVVWDGSNYVPQNFPPFDTTLASRYDMLFRDTNTWIHTAQLLQWNPDSQYLQLANAHSINWLNAASATAELLQFEQTGVAGPAMDYYVFEGTTDSRTQSATYVDTANGLDQAQSGMVHGDEYLLVVRASITKTSAVDGAGFRTAIGGTPITGSEMKWSNAAGSTASNPAGFGVPYNYVTYFTANTGGGNITTQHMYPGGSGSEYHDSQRENALILNLTTDVPNHVKDSSAVLQEIDHSTTWQDSDVSVVLAAGDWIIYLCLQSDGYNTANTTELGIDIDGGTTVYSIDCFRTTDSADDLGIQAGAFYLDNYAGGTVKLVAKAGSAISHCDLIHKTMVALPLSDFAEATAKQNTSASLSYAAADDADEILDTVNHTVVTTGSDFVAVGWAQVDMTGTGEMTGFGLVEEIDGGGETRIGWDRMHGHRYTTHDNETKSNLMVSSTRTYTTGNSVDLKIEMNNPGANYAIQGHRWWGMALLRMSQPSTLSEDFYVGDASYDTIIDGAQVDVIADLHLTDGKSLFLWDAANEDNLQFQHTGLNVYVTANGASPTWSIVVQDLLGWVFFEDGLGLSMGYDQSENYNMWAYVVSETEFYIHHDGITDWTIHDLERFNLHTGVKLRLYDSSDTYFVDQWHDGNDFNTVGDNTTDWNISGFTDIEVTAGNILVDGHVEAEHFQFDLAYGGSAEVGNMHWNPDDGTVNIGLLGGEVVLQVGQEVNAYAKATEAISNGDTVYASGAIGASGKIEIKKFIADATIPAIVYAGIATEDIANGEFGYVTVIGVVRGIDTTGPGIETWAEGTLLYCSPTTAGGLTNVPPTAQDQTIPTAFVINAHAINGSIYVRPTNPFNLAEQHDTHIVSVADNELLHWVAADERWENTADITLDSLTVLGKLNASTTTVTGTSFTADDDHVILVDDDTAGSTVTITLPTAATANTIYHIKKLGTTANVIIDGNGSETIDGALTITIAMQYASVMVISDGSNWNII